MDDRELRRVFTLASAFKEGDLAAGGTTDDRLRDEARRALLATTVGEIRRTPLVADAMTAALERTRDRRFDGELDPLTVAEPRRDVDFDRLLQLAFVRQDADERVKAHGAQRDLVRRHDLRVVDRGAQRRRQPCRLVDAVARRANDGAAHDYAVRDPRHGGGLLRA